VHLKLKCTTAKEGQSVTTAGVFGRGNAFFVSSGEAESELETKGR
jgi:hypothetical protein